MKEQERRRVVCPRWKELDVMACSWGEATGRHSCRSHCIVTGTGEQCWGGRTLKEKV